MIFNDLKAFKWMFSVVHGDEVQSTVVSVYDEMLLLLQAQFLP